MEVYLTFLFLQKIILGLHVWGGRDGMYQNVRLRIHREGQKLIFFFFFFAFVIYELPLIKKTFK